MIYGYSKRIADEKHGLHEMREVSFEFAPSDLRRVAAFLNSAADALEQDSLRSSHVHIDSWDRGWNADFPNCDVIVLHPPPPPPRVVESE